MIRKEAYGRSVDWWCLGAVLYEMLYGLPPFYSRDVSVMYDAILHKPLTFRDHIHVSKAAKSLLHAVNLFLCSNLSLSRKILSNPARVVVSFEDSDWHFVKFCPECLLTTFDSFLENPTRIFF